MVRHGGQGSGDSSESPPSDGEFESRLTLPVAGGGPAPLAEPPSQQETVIGALADYEPTGPGSGSSYGGGYTGRDATTGDGPYTTGDGDSSASMRGRLGGVVPGQVLAERYCVVRQIGSGGMGEVWEARHIVIGKSVALKILGLDPTEGRGAEQAERLVREAQAVSRIEHENIIDITDFGHTPVGAPFFAMELLDGRPLERLLQAEGWLPWPRARHIIRQLIDALVAAHRAGVIHRDVKPDNIFVLDRALGTSEHRDFIKILDFGIAKSTMLTGVDPGLTKTGMVFGTPAYMSPEQAEGKPVDERTDVYSLGCVFHQILTGELPFPGDTPAEMLYRQLFHEPAPVRQVTPEARIPPAMEAVVLRCLRKDPALRFDSMEQLRDAVDAVGSQAPPTKVPQEHLPVPPPELRTWYARRTERAITNPTAGARAHPQVRATGPNQATSHAATGVAATVGILGAVAVAAVATFAIMRSGVLGQPDEPPTEATDATDAAAPTQESPPSIEGRPVPARVAPPGPATPPTAAQPVPDPTPSVGQPVADHAPDAAPTEAAADPQGRRAEKPSQAATRRKRPPPKKRAEDAPTPSTPPPPPPPPPPKPKKKPDKDFKRPGHDGLYEPFG